MTTRAEIVAEARSWLGTPWVHQHCLKGVAVDCAQMIMAIGKARGLVPEDLRVDDYGREPNGTILKVCSEHMDPIRQADMLPGDVVVVMVEHQPQHLGVVADYVHGGLSVVHASSAGRKQVIETRLAFMRGFRYVAAYRFRGVE